MTCSVRFYFTITDVPSLPGPTITLYWPGSSFVGGGGQDAYTDPESDGVSMHGGEGPDSHIQSVSVVIAAITSGTITW